jgi:hypothetical protein
VTKAPFFSAFIAVALVLVALLPANAQWRATAWTMDLKNDTDMCLYVTAGQEGDPKPIDVATVWAHRSQHFDDNHTTLVIHAKVWEKLDCTGRFVADLHDDIQQIRNVMTVVKQPDGKFMMRREKHW